MATKPHEAKVPKAHPPTVDDLLKRIEALEARLSHVENSTGFKKHEEPTA